MISGSLVNLAQSEKWPPMTSDLIDWGTKQGIEMDSPSNRRIKNGQSPGFIAEELRQIQRTKETRKTCQG
ncbi:hypothetical protein GcC1_083028 [Golovinomyces cichoracearum]|uniref:Uncharacterized protein n=1 Tax=Golovinomyces cichoracearum TaxID=62708 RepID=A0A420IJ93_9PEZI|nr:hypothetical protein GcC1_083028 [Golovinomyces cichoracearum]